MDSRKGLVIGLDGVDYDFLTDHRDSLETLDELLADGCSGRLRSTIPPTTSAAWSAVFSGMSPGRTGVTDFETGEEESAGIVDSTNVRVPRAWDVADYLERRVAVIGVPLTFPTTPVDGLMVSGFLSPDGSERFYPADVEKTIPDGYEFFLKYSDFAPSEKKEFLDCLYASTEAKFEFLKDVIRGEVPNSADLDLICFVLSETDMAQHYLRKQPTADGYEEGERQILEFFKYVDDHIAEVIELVEDWNVGLLSDHGFGKNSTKHVHLNQWLIDNGFLQLKKGTSNHLTSIIRNNIRSVLRLPGADYLKRLTPDTVTSQVAALESLSDSEIDWKRTVARFSQGESNIGYVSIMDDVSDRDSIIDKVVTGLQEISDPETGRPVVEKVYQRSDYYSGPDLSDLPDVVLVYHDQYTGSERPNESVVEEIPPSERPPTGHKMDGFYCFVGNKFTSGYADANIVDFMPTMYTALEIPLPVNTDGSIVSEALDVDPDSLSRQKYSFDPQHEEGPGTTDDVRDRLEELGYM